MGVKGRKRKQREIMYDCVFVGPALIIFLIFVLLPFLMSVILSFTSWNGQTAPEWTGLSNYKLIFSGTDSFGRNLWFTAKYAFMYVAAVNILGLVFAVLLTNKFVKFRNLSRTMIILPYMVSGLVLGFIWQFIFNKVFPQIGTAMNSDLLETSWLATPKMAFYALVMPAVTIGLFYAANTAFKVFDVNFALTNGGPANSTVSVAMDIYNEAFARSNHGLGCAKSTIFFLVVAALTFVQLKFTQSREVQM